MFLRTLSNEQKRLFLSLAEKAADANDVREESETKLLEAYADEMGIEADVEQIEIDGLYSALLKISNPVEINQMTFEIVGMLLCDGEYDNKEKEFMEKLSRELKVPAERIDKMFDLANLYFEVIKSINKIMFDV